MAVVRVFPDTDMRMGISGLTEMMLKAKVKLSGSNDMMLFINKKMTACKITWDGRFCLHLRKPADEGRITIDEIQSIPSFFKGRFLEFKIQRRAQEILGSTFHVKAV